MSASVTRAGDLDMQVCVPKTWTDDEVVRYAESKYPCGTTNGWCIRRDGDSALAGDPERVKCSADPNQVHIMLDA